MNNEKTLNKGLNKGLQIIIDHLIDNMIEICGNLLLQVAKNRSFQGWSGNTQTSYLGGVYYDGKLVQIVNQNNWNKPAIRKKIRKGKWGYLKTPYEGNARSVFGSVDTDEDFGLNTSYQFIRSYKFPKGHIGFVITTGTEYSVILEEIKNLDVLTKTFEDASNILINGFKPLN